MKAIGIFRGFPGLGRVVAGLDILIQLQVSAKLEAIVFTYFQGYELRKSYNFDFRNIENRNDISSIGIIPVSKSGETIIDSIEEYNPDFVLIDGEPLLVTAIKLRFPKLIVVALLNPFDVENPHNNLSSQLFFKECYSKADITIVHGLLKVEKPATFNKSFHSINTFIRHDLDEIIPDANSNRIACILGGGTVNSSDLFFENTIRISQQIIELANKQADFFFDIYCGCETVYSRVNQFRSGVSNIDIHKHIHNPNQLYKSTKAVISRGGRNTVSELLSLNLPAILFSTTCEVRGTEQQANISIAQTVSPNIFGVTLSTDSNTIEGMFNKIISANASKIEWTSGNKKLFEILQTELPCM